MQRLFLKTLVILCVTGCVIAPSAKAQGLVLPAPYVGDDVVTSRPKSRNDAQPVTTSATTISDTEEQNSLAPSNEQNGSLQDPGRKRRSVAMSDGLQFVNGQGWVRVTERPRTSSALVSARKPLSRSALHQAETESIEKTQGATLENSTVTRGTSFFPLNAEAPHGVGSASGSMHTSQSNGIGGERASSITSDLSFVATSNSAGDPHHPSWKRDIWQTDLGPNRLPISAQGYSGTNAQLPAGFTYESSTPPNSVFGHTNAILNPEGLTLPDHSFSFEPGKHIVLSAEDINTLFAIRRENSSNRLRQIDCLRARESHIGYATWKKTCGPSPVGGKQKKKVQSRNAFDQADPLHSSDSLGTIH